MRIYFSANDKDKVTPEKLIASRIPHVMISFFYILNQRTVGKCQKDRMKRLLKILPK